MRRKAGFSIIETGAAMTVLFPVLILILYVMLEVSYALFLKSALSEASRQAARNLAIAYGQNPSIAQSRELEESMVLSQVRIPNVVNDSAQFDRPVWNTTNSPTTVSVNVRYASKQYGLPPFPNPDVLNLGDAFVLTARSTYRLE